MTRLLHGSDGSPYARIVRILLHEKGLEHERNTARMAERDIEETAALNPALRVPILEEDGRTLFESRIIAEYLLASYRDNAPETPSPPLAAALTRPEHHWDDSLVLATVYTVLDGLVLLWQMGQGGVKEGDVPYVARFRPRIEKSLDWLEVRATPEGFLPGSFSVQDIAAICALEMAEERKIVEWRGRSKLEALFAALAQRPSVAATRPG